MEKIKVKVVINNKDIPYKYVGDAYLNRDIIEYNDNVNNYTYDLKINRFIKVNKEDRVVIDFDKEEIIVNDKYKLGIEIKSKKISDKERIIVYNTGNSDIEFKFMIVR